MDPFNSFNPSVAVLSQSQASTLRHHKRMVYKSKKTILYSNHPETIIKYFVTNL